MRAPVALLIPSNAHLDIIAIRRDLHCCSWRMFVEPANVANELLLIAVSPQAQVVWLYCVHTEFGAFSTTHPLRPHIARQAIREQAEVIRRLFRLHEKLDRLGAESRP